MADHNTREGKFRRGFGGVALGGALAAFFIAPLVKFADPVVLAIGGGLAGMGLLGLYNVKVVPGVKPVAEKFAWVFIVLGGFLATVALVFASEASWSVDGYCAGVQERMISNAGQGIAIGDAKDVLQALQCRPQKVTPLRSLHPAPAPAALPDRRSGSAVQTR